MSSSHHARASSLAGGHGGKVRGPESGRDATAACPVCAGAYQQTSWGSEDVSAGGGHGASFVRLCSLHQDASSLAAKSAHRGGPREGYTHAAADASFNSKTERESGSLRQSLHQHHRRCEDANQASADELGIALSSQYDDTDLGAGSASSRRRDESDAESLAYYEALADAVGDDHLHQAAAAGRSSSSARKNVQASRATTTAPSREHDSDMESDPDGGEDSSDDDRNRAEIRNGATQRRDRGSGGGGKGTRKSSKKGRKHRVELHSSDEEAEQPETKRAAREYMVGEIDERELAIGRRIAWYPNGPGWIEKVYHGMWRGRQVIVKVPRTKELKNKELRRFRKAVAKRITVAHPNVVSCLGACTVPGRFKIIEETLDEGGLSRLLRGHRQSASASSPTEGPWSLYHRMMMASDIAAGMAWLHTSVPPIIYGDLNSANLSVEYREGRAVVKVANFGFPMLYGSSYYPHKAAPEMLGTPISSHRSFTKEADVYAFGLILWELLTMEEPYPYNHYGNLDELIEVVCRQKERPQLPSDCPSALRQLIQACWHHEPVCRPDFTQITTKLDEIFIRMAIRDEEGQRFWIENFPRQQTVEWGPFVRAFYRFLKVRPPRGRRLVQAKTSGDEQLRRHEKEQEDREEAILQCFKTLVVAKDVVDEGSMTLGTRMTARRKETVHIQQFGRILEWFGPISKNVTLPPPRPSSKEDEYLNPRRHMLLRKSKDKSNKLRKGDASRRPVKNRRKRHSRRKRADSDIYSSDNEDSVDSAEHEREPSGEGQFESSEESDDDYDADAMVIKSPKLVDFTSMLPVELSLAIFRYFDEYDWTELQSVCKSWSTIIAMLRNRQGRQRLQANASKNRSIGRSLDRRPSQESVTKPRPDPHAAFLRNRGMSTSSLGATSAKRNSSAISSSNKLLDSKEKKGGTGGKMEWMGKQFKSSSLLTRKRRTKAYSSSSSSSSDTDGESDLPREESPRARKEKRKERPRNADDSIYCSWSDDEDDSGSSCINVPRVAKRTLLDDIHSVLTQKWFHGELETADATYRIQNCPQGTFLVRFSTNSTHPGAFTITRVAAGPSIGHIRITRSDDGKGRFIVNKDMVFDSLVETIESTKHILGLVTPCPGSPFHKKFCPSAPSSPALG